VNQLYGAIDLGSNSIKMKIVQYVDSSFKCLENITKEVDIGEAVFTKGYLKHDKVEEIISVLEYFKQVMETYEVERYRAVATSAMRFTENSQNIMELILMKTGFKVEILEDTVEKFITYKSIRDNVPGFQEIRQGSLLVELNTGSCDVSMYLKNRLVMNEEFFLGTKILKNLMKQIEAMNVNYLPVVGEFIEARTNHIFRMIKNKKIHHYLVVGGEVKPMKDLLFGGSDEILRRDFEKVYQRITTDHREIRHLVEEKGVDWYELVSTVLLYHTFFKLVKTDVMVPVNVNLRDGIIAGLIEEDYQLNRYQLFNQDTIFLATSIAKRYKTNLPHVKWIQKNALIIFGEMKQHYPFDERDEVILQLSALLHEIGKFTRMKDYMNTSFSKIKNLSVLGITEEEMKLVAYVCLMMISPKDFKKNENAVMVREDQINRIFKLGAILSLADALDKSKRQKITLTRVTLSDGDLKLTAQAQEDVTLEYWDYEQKRRFFINTYGIHPRLEFV